MQRDAEGRVAVVTGGAQSIGQAFALRLARDGHRVAIADLQPTDETERLIAEAGGESFGLECDISSRESVGAFADAVRERFGRCDVLVASAGIYPVIPFAELEWEDWRRILAVNVDSLFHLSKAFVPGMVENGWGRVIAVSSTTFHTGTPSFVAYTTSKGGVLSMTREIAVEYARKGIRCNALCPGPIETPLLLALLSDEEKKQRRFVHIPMGRLGHAEELAKAALFLASDDSSYMTGASLIVDGGITAAYVTPED